MAGFGAALVLLLGITAGMAGGYIPRISKEIFLLGILVAMILGMLSYILIKKSVEKRKNWIRRCLSRNMVRRKKRQLYILKIRKNLVRCQGAMPVTAEKNWKRSKKYPDKSGRFLDGFGETVVLSAGASKGPATLVSREPGELATIYLEKISQ